MKSFRRNLILGFVSAILLLIISSGAAYISIQNLMSSAGRVNHTMSIISNLKEVMSLIKDAETGQRGYLLTKNETFLQPYKKALESVDVELQELYTLVADNPQQVMMVDSLSVLLQGRLEILERNISRSATDTATLIPALQSGKYMMDQIRLHISRMEQAELRQLKERDARFEKLTTFTPIIIVVASFIAIIITVISFRRTVAEFEHRATAQNELEEKDADIRRRINIIQDIADKISQGDYSVRAHSDGEDGLGRLSFAINKMAASLDESFQQLADKEWLQTGVASLNDMMLGEYDMKVLSKSVVDTVVNYTDSIMGAIYLRDGEQSLKFYGGYAVTQTTASVYLDANNGLIAETFKKGVVKVIGDIAEDQLQVSFGAGHLKPKTLVLIPLLHERKVQGVLLIGGLRQYSFIEVQYFKEIAGIIGTVVNGVETRKKLQELFEETQSQAEELQAQHNELENINSELEAQTERLQASEEELRVQQQELLEANDALEDRARLLEQKNQLVFERNLEIQKKAEELELSTRYKSEFLANMSHELRTPLNSILLLSRLMVENTSKNLTAEQIEYAQVIHGSGQGLLALIDEILDLSKIEAGKMELSYADISIREVLDDMKQLFDPIAREKDLLLNVTLDEGLPYMMETDKMRLEQILKNLISNALKFTGEGYVKLQAVRTPAKPDHISFAVTDTGIGIMPDKQNVIFEAFQQEDGSTRRKYGGTGLGLSISRELAKLLKGEITLESEPGKGSTFILVLPLTKQAAESVQSNAESSIVTPVELLPAEKMMEKNVTAHRFLADNIPLSIKDDRENIESDDKVILIVEDDTAFAKSLLKFTRKNGYKGIVSVRGDEARALAEQYQPHGILLDIQLPMKDGWEIMEELKGNPSTKHIPVHMMSSHDAKFQSLSKGAINFVYKPLSVENIQEIFEKIELFNSTPTRSVLIVESNVQHAKALGYFLETFDVDVHISTSVASAKELMESKPVSCIVLDLDSPQQQTYTMLDELKRSKDFESIPTVIFTGKNISSAEELRLKQYSNSIVIKTAHSYQRVLDEVSLFLHVVAEKNENKLKGRKSRMLTDVLKNKTVLIADDDVRNIYSLTKALEGAEMKVISAVNGKEALQMLEENRGVDIVLMDMMMPEMDGYETTRRIKTSSRFKKIPVIAVTAKAMAGDREKCINAGASDYISKPVDIDQLMSLLRVWLYDAAK